MQDKGNFKRGSVELLILYLLSKQDYYGYEISALIKEISEGILDIPVGSLYPALYKLIDAGYIMDYQKKVGKRLVRVYYHIEKLGLERLSILQNDYEQTTFAIKKILAFEPPEENNDDK